MEIFSPHKIWHITSGTNYETEIQIKCQVDTTSFKLKRGHSTIYDKTSHDKSYIIFRYWRLFKCSKCNMQWKKTISNLAVRHSFLMTEGLVPSSPLNFLWYFYDTIWHYPGSDKLQVTAHTLLLTDSYIWTFQTRPCAFIISSRTMNHKS